MRVTVLTFTFNDWESLSALIPRIVTVFEAYQGWQLRVLVVDDGSTQVDRDFARAYTGEAVVEVVTCRSNIGHQRAIAVGLCHVYENIPSDFVVVMDGDGEDQPEDIPLLLQEADAYPDAVIFAERARRTESLFFRFMYKLYLTLHGLLVTRAVKVGNFSVLPASVLQGLVVRSSLWNHYAATIVSSRTPRQLVSCPRGYRIRGSSKMNFVALVTHGISALACYGEIVAVRLLVMAVLGLLVGGLGLILPLSVASVPTWAKFLGIMLLQTCFFSFAGAFVLLTQRALSTVIPLRDYRWFLVGGTRAVTEFSEIS